jgi:para-nitrobenzyl esterase
MIAALEWVRENISNFGGDPANVTIFGKSAGGMAIGALLVMPSAKGLFHKAVLESGSNTVHSQERSKKVAKRYLEVLNVPADDVEALKSLPTAEWLAALEEVAQPNPETGVMPMQPVVDGDLLPELPLAGLANGRADGVPILIGSNLEEWKLMSGLDPDMAGLDEAGMVDRLSQSASNWDILKVIKAYQHARVNRGVETSPREVFSAIQTDRIYRIPAIRLLEAHRKRGNPAYNYLFTWTSPLMDGVLGACHVLEIAFVFGTYKLAEAFFGSGTAADDLSGKVQDAWLAFARTGNPGCSALGTWPAYGEQRRTMLLGKDTKVADALYEEERLAWESVPDTITGIL